MVDSNAKTRMSFSIVKDEKITNTCLSVHFFLIKHRLQIFAKSGCIGFHGFDNLNEPNE